MNIQAIKLTDLSIHELASLNPKMTDSEFHALQLDIEANSQLDPITVYRGKIIDGRHRYKAIINIGLDTILADVLPNNMTLEQLRNIIMIK